SFPVLLSQVSCKAHYSAPGHEAKTVEREVEQHLLQTMTVRGHSHAFETVDQFQSYARLSCQRLKEFAHRAQQGSQIGRNQFGTRLAVKVEHVVNGRGQGSQACLQMLDPAPPLGIELRISEQPGKQLHAAQRISDLMRQHR